MTNHNYLHIKNVTLEQIKEDIDEINKMRFYDKLNIEILKGEKGWDNGCDTIYIFLEENNLGMWFNEEGILEIRNQGYPEFEWIGYIIETTLSVKYDAFKGGEGVGEEKWKGDLNKWNTYIDYLLKGNTKRKRLKWAKQIAEQVAKDYDCKFFLEGIK